MIATVVEGAAVETVRVRPGFVPRVIAGIRTGAVSVQFHVVKIRRGWLDTNLVSKKQDGRKENTNLIESSMLM